ncbi:MAG: serpin family protein [Promethearchaeota archaeon]
MRNVKEVELIEATNAFAIELYLQLSEPEKNLFISPLSIFTTLAMVYAGARDSTAKQMEATLHIPLKQHIFHKVLKNLLNKLRSVERNKNTELSIANLLCVKEDYDLLDKFLWTIEDNYDSPIWKLDFSFIDESCAKINEWVAKQTRGKISKIIDSIDIEMRLILINAIYFKGMWENTFDKEFTKEEYFTLLSGEKILVKMMHQTKNFNYLEDKQFQILEMPYKANMISGIHEQMSMIIFLPKHFNTLPELESHFTIENVENFLSSLREQYTRKVKVIFPRFTIKMKYKLTRALSELGIVDAFTKSANFSGISKEPNIFISEVIHKSFVEVNERGTEAAAVTAIGIVGASIGPIKEPPIFRADHPFIFLIQDSQTKTVLFIGKLMNPKV